MKFQLDDGFLVYDQVGSGIPILFIHGYPLSRKIWEPQRRELTDIANVITVDLRGHGESFPFMGPYAMDLLAEDCYKLLREINVEFPIIVCGLSMGGYVTFALYRKYPQLFRGVILTSTRAAPDSPEGKANREAGIKNVQERGVPYIAQGMLQKLVSPTTLENQPDLVSSVLEIMLETSVNGVVGALQGMRDRQDSTPLLPEIKCPALIIHGADDQLIRVKDAEFMDQHIPDSRLVVMPQSGHLSNMEHPNEFNNKVREFVRALS